ncbi:MAG: EamA family transporter [Solirubrobacteraceae bacterium]|nr:EamA family transporter [Solirubrobacteraceae bacterium]
MIAILLALSAAVSWGTGDFLGGMAARRYALLWVLLASAFGGLLLSGVATVVSGDSAPTQEHLLLAAAAGLAGLVALAAFYQALAIGTMSIVAPITATGSAIPVLWGVIGRGESLTLFAVIAIVVAVCGVILASREQDKAETTGVDDATHRRSILLAIVAAIGFGTIFTLIAEAGEESIFWPAAALKATTLAAVVLIVLLAGSRRATWGARPRGLQWWFPISIGFFDVTANMTFAAAAQRGALAITSVVSSLYPVITVLLAFFFLHERLAVSQRVGVVMALVGVAMLAAA